MNVFRLQWTAEVSLWIVGLAPAGMIGRVRNPSKKPWKTPPPTGAQVTALQGVMIVALIYGMQLLLSPIWLRYFEFGAFEWIWRRLAY